MLAYWASLHGSVLLADWDESDAFCNIPRADAELLLQDIIPGLGRWAQHYYGALSIRTATPYSLTDPYPMAHGGGQGDSGGVGLYLAVGIQRTRCHRGLLLGNRDPREPARHLPLPAPRYPAAPYDPTRPVLEVAATTGDP